MPVGQSLVPNFRYKALTQAGEIVTGSISAPTATEVARRIEYLGLVPVDTVTEERPEGAGNFFTLTQRADPSSRLTEGLTQPKSGSTACGAQHEAGRLR